MAIDTADKRRSSTTALMPFYPASVSIDGSMSQADRQEAAWGYSGILAGAEAVVSGIYSAVEIETSYSSEAVKTSYSAREKATSYRAKTDQE